MMIPISEINYSKLSSVDEYGRVFHWRGRIFRGIHANYETVVHELFDCGLLEELTLRGFFPRSTITEYEHESFNLVIEHEIISAVSYPHEWSFSMYRDAALFILEVNDIANKYNWCLKDCQPYNVLFNGTQPVFVDMGSFIQTNMKNFPPSREFLSCYLQPLSIWALGDYFLAQRIISSAHEVMPLFSWRLYNDPLMKVVSSRLRTKIENLWSLISCRVLSALRGEKKIHPFIFSLARFMPAEILIENSSLLRLKVKQLKSPQNNSAWQNYHDENFFDGALISTGRYDRIIEIVKSLDCNSVVELAGNQGFLSLLILLKTQIKTAVCTDCDCNAIDKLYKYCLNNPLLPEGKIIQPVVVNFMIPEMNYYTEPPSERFRSDIVTALAITHHLTITQHYSLSDVMKTIESYTRKYALIEFMPLGLWNGHTAPPLPSWYCHEWFLKEFTKFFDLISIEQVEENRILHLGQLKNI